ncbi:hypothetical protein UK99_03100 [Frankia casuarinae]|uniref:hypothetical protein n=1 Tax=Frankia TaxID=1854 RepID=UPI0004DD2614|nr:MULTISPECIES: hypothetical protein [Frankia]KEZ37058.1 hypothetical protein CEDDRAFT_01585 [Frankia sp. CeD]ORT98024.1 hypothetical protein UK99_03100 [Frankia casuarinae]
MTEPTAKPAARRRAAAKPTTKAKAVEAAPAEEPTPAPVDEAPAGVEPTATEAPTTEAKPKRVNTSHEHCAHPKTKAARAACRRERAKTV